MIRVLRGQPSTLSVLRDTRPTSATVTITRDRDATVVASAAACQVEADRVVYSLAARSGVENLTAVFTIVDPDGTSTVTEVVQVVGSRACSVSDVRRLKPCDDPNRYPTELILRCIQELETALEDACGVSFVVREQVVTMDGNGTGDLYVRAARPQSVSSVSVSDSVASSALSAQEITDLRIDSEAGVLVRPSLTWPAGRRNVTVTGTFGYSSVPGIVRQAVALGVRQMLIDSRVDPRAQSVTNEDGTTAQLVTAGVRGATFSLPELNQVVMQYRTSFGVA